MATINTLNQIRSSLENHLGKTILLSADKGRKQIVTKKGVLEKVYPSIFVVRIENEPSGFLRVSYSYSDLLTSTVKLKVYKQNNLSVT